MHNQLIPILLLLVLPALYLGHRSGLLGDHRVRWVAGIGLAGAVAWSLPYEGVDFLYLKRMKLLLAAAIAVLLLLRCYRIPWTLRAGPFRAVLTALAALAAVVYLNFFSFHGERTFVHLHDVAHYYLGAKYYAELGYSDLYTAMLRAEAELHENHFKAIEARDLRTYEQVHIRTLLQDSAPVKAAFTPRRWAEFQRDVDYFRGTLGPKHGQVLLDHGFNPTPVWALLGGSLASRVPGGSERGILLLCLLDTVLLAALFAAVAWAFGREAMLLSLIYFCVFFGSGFGWTGGAFLRFPWLFALVAGVCCYRKGRHAGAGALAALAAMLRIFPAIFAVGLACKAAAVLLRHRRLPRRTMRFFAAFAVTGLVLFGLTALLPRGWDHWGELRHNMSTHLENISPNVVGLTEILAFQRGGGPVTAEEFATLKTRRQRIYAAQLLLVLAPLALLVARLSRRQSDLGAMLLGLPLILAGLSLAAYYYIFLLLLILAFRKSSRDLALIFSVEVVAYVLLLFEDREGLLYVYRGLAVAVLYLALGLRRLPSM